MSNGLSMSCKHDDANKTEEEVNELLPEKLMHEKIDSYMQRCSDRCIIRQENKLYKIHSIDSIEISTK